MPETVADPRHPLVADIWKQCVRPLRPDPSRTVLRPFNPEYPAPYDQGEGARAKNIIGRLLAITDDALLDRGFDYLTAMLDSRHRDMRSTLMRRYDELAHLVPDGAELDERRKLLIGGFFTEEYAFEAAALFNPSAVRHWDQSGLDEGAIRFIASLRAIGEGHVSSVTFLTGIWSADGSVETEEISRYAEPPVIEKLDGDGSALRLRFEHVEGIDEAVLFPMAPSQRQGIEDVRLVEFIEDDGSCRYIGTYTAFDGRDIRQEILTTADFRSFEMRPLTGKVAQNKGMALFPRRIGGRFAMIGRQDNENIWLMTSDDLYCWDEADKIITPRHPWEAVQMGNCGSPLEIDEGWLLMIHSVGMVRNYTIGACLLDRDDPSKVLARTRMPLLRPDPANRDGYVPNVVYSCGSIVDGRRLMLPYGVADNFTAFATTTVDRILDLMEP